MPMLTELADVLRAGGAKVEEVDGWKTRGNTWENRDGSEIHSIARVTGGLVHHTGTATKHTGNYPTLKTILNGRSDLPGLLAQLGLGRDGTWYVCGAGLAWHAGAVDDANYHNLNAIGVEAEHSGLTSEPWKPAMYASYVLGCAILGNHYGITWRGHKEAAVPAGRKTDPNFDMAKFRADVARKQAELTAPRYADTLVNALLEPDERKTLQARIGTEADGDFGPNSYAAWKSRMSLPATATDGQLYRRVQAYLNTIDAKYVPTSLKTTGVLDATTAAAIRTYLTFNGSFAGATATIGGL